MKRLAPLSAVCVAMLAIASCGGENRTGELTTNTKALQLVRASDVNRQLAGSPERAVLRWWRLLQFRNASESLAAFTPGVRAQLRRSGFQDLLFQDFGPWIQRASPRIVGTELSGGRASVDLEITVNDPVGIDLVRRSRQFAGLTLDRVGGQWLVADSTFFLQQANMLRRARLQSEQDQTRR
jgi:hypothetical protein